MLDENRSKYVRDTEQKTKDIERMNKMMERLAIKERLLVEKVSTTQVTQQNAITNLQKIADKSSKGSSIIYMKNLTTPKTTSSPGYIRMVENSQEDWANASIDDIIRRNTNRQFVSANDKS